MDTVGIDYIFVYIFFLSRKVFLRVIYFSYNLYSPSCSYCTVIFRRMMRATRDMRFMWANKFIARRIYN